MGRRLPAIHKSSRQVRNVDGECDVAFPPADAIGRPPGCILSGELEQQIRTDLFINMSHNGDLKPLHDM